MGLVKTELSRQESGGIIIGATSNEDSRNPHKLLSVDKHSNKPIDTTEIKRMRIKRFRRSNYNVTDGRNE